MRILFFLVVLSGFFFLSLTQNSSKISPERQWPWYRGYFASGVLDKANLPETWDVEKSKNIKWKVEIQGLGLSSPIVWDNKLFITTAISKDDKTGLKTGIYGNIEPINDTSVHEWKTYCIEKKSGKILWERVAYKGIPKIKRHSKSSHANSTPATDGKHIVSFFGSEGLYCYNFSGDLLWKKDFGILKSVFFMAEGAEWEFGSSPIIYNDVVIIQCDVLNNSFLAAFDVKTGKELWKTNRDEYPGWCTPNIYIEQGKPNVVVNGYKHRGAYDFKTGAEIWKMNGGGDIPIPTPIINGSLIYFNSAHGKSSPIMAIKTDAKGDITLKEKETTNQHVLWCIERGGSYMQTMLVYGDYLYNCQWNGAFTCIDAKTGKQIYKEKLGKMSSFVSSPVASDGKIYVADENGLVFVIQAGATFKVLAENQLGGICMSTPALADNYIFYRTNSHLIAISK